MSLKESIPIELGGKTRHLRFDFNAMVALEEELKISIMEIGTILSGAVKLKDIRAILWAGLIHEDPALTPRDVGALIGGVNDLAMLGEKIRDAFEAAFPPPEPGARKNARGRAKSGTLISS